jgi:hypothetical protein
MSAETIDFIIEEMKEHSLNCWNIMDGKNKLSEQDDEGMDIGTSIQKLKSKLTSLGARYVSVNLSGVNKSRRKGAEAMNVRKYTILAGTGKEVPQIIAPVAGIPYKELDALREANEKLKLQLIEYKYEQKLNDLHKKIEGLESEDDSPIGRLETILIPIITEIFTSGKTSQVVAPTINGVKEETLIDQWISVDSDAPEVLKKIVTLAITKPDVYKTYKPILLSI